MIRKLLRKRFKIKVDDDFIDHQPPTKEQIADFEEKKHKGPVLADLKLDVYGTQDSPWNKKVYDILLKDFLEDNDLGERKPSDDYFLDLILRKCVTLRTAWRGACNRYKSDGEKEVDDEACEHVPETKNRTMQ